MKPTLQAINSVGNLLTLNNVIEKTAVTYLSKNSLAGATTLHVENTESFTPSGILLVSVKDSENAEFIEYSAITTSTITIDPALLDHSRGETVNVVIYNQFKIQNSTDGISWSDLIEIDIDPTSTNTKYVDTSTTGNYYRAAYRNSVTGDISDYSDAILSRVAASNSAQGVINSVMLQVGISPVDTIITQEFLLDALNEARRLFDDINTGHQWSYRQKFNQKIKILSGSNFFNLPDDVDFSQSNRSVLSVRMNGYGNGWTYPLEYVDKKLWNDINIINQGSVLTQDVNIGDTSIFVENSGDFLSRGPLYFATTDFSQSLLVTQYSANDLDTNELSGIPTGAITRFIPKGTQVWSRILGTAYPMCYTVYEGKVWFNQVIPQILQGKNALVDYYSKLEDITDPSTVLNEHHYKIYGTYIKYAIEKRKDPSTPTTHPDFVLFTTQAKAVMENEQNGQPTRIVTRR